MIARSALICTGLLIVHSTTVPAQPPGKREQAPQPKQFAVTVADAVRSALTYHPDVLKKKVDVEISRLEERRQSALFRPILTAQASNRRESTYIDDPAVDASGVVNTRTTTIETAIGGRTTFGGVYSLNFRGEHVDGANPTHPRLAPEYLTLLSARYTQPILRNAGSTANRGLIDRAKITTALTDEELRERRQLLALQVVASYWTLVVRREEVTIRETSSSEAADLRDLVERRIKGGDAPKSDLIQADVTVAERQQLVRVAQLAVVDAERALLTLTYLNRDGQLGWDTAVVPTNKFGGMSQPADYGKELEVAYRSRPELVRVERALSLAKLDHAIAENSRKFRLDLFVEAGVFGAAGTSAVPAGDPNAPPAQIVGGLGKGLSNMYTGEAPFVELGVQLEIPLGNGDRAGAARQAKLRIDQVRADDQRTLVALDVRAAMQILELARSRLNGATGAEKLAALNIEAQRKRYVGGAATIFDTLRAQDEFARAKAETVLAAAEHEVAQIRLIAARGTLLEHFGFRTNK